MEIGKCNIHRKGNEIEYFRVQTYTLGNPATPINFTWFEFPYEKGKLLVVLNIQ